MRGKPPIDGAEILKRRITPADAGKTLTCRPKPAKPWDHPRGCGENPDGGAVKCLNIGSPPRMRGKLCQCCLRRPRSRITPADAGKTTSRSYSMLCCRDHPRGCGENVAHDNTDSRKPGSPPRMRGKHVASSATGDRVRITPADAGKTRYSTYRSHLHGDHPRGCGENLWI